MDTTLAVPSAVVAASTEAPLPRARDASALEVFNVPLFEIPPTLDVRAMAEFERSHVLCAVSVPTEDGLDERRLFQRILDHDENYGWMLQHPFVIVYDDGSRSRASWLVSTLQSAVAARANVDGFEGADSSERLLRRLALQCREVLLLRHSDFEETFPTCCSIGQEFAACPFFDRLGPLPRCGLLEPRIYVAGRQVSLTADLLGTLGITHVVANGDAIDVMDGTSGGGEGSQPFRERPADVPGVCYLKCDLADRDGGEEVTEVLAGVARFVASAAAHGGVVLVRLHGQSRSASVVLAFLVQCRGLSLEQAWKTFDVAGVQVDQRLVWWDALLRLPPGFAALQDKQMSD